MFDASSINGLLKFGAVGLAIVVAGLILFGVYKFIQLVLPVVLAFKPGDGNGNKGGQLFTVLTEISSLATDLKVLSNEINSFTQTIRDHVPTRADLLAQFEKNRHDVRDIVGEGTLILEAEIKRNRRVITDRRKSKSTK